MSKFILYMLDESNMCNAVFSGDELSHCLSYIRTNNLMSNRCMIISPNGRRITFTANGNMIFGEIANSSKISA